jgi:ribosomal protein L44E
MSDNTAGPTGNIGNQGVSGNLSVSGDISTANFSKNFSTTTTNTKTYESLETGRVEKGDDSNQDFQEIDLDFETLPFHTITYFLKPQSTKPVNMSEVRNYCTECGYRIRKSHWSFCPKCGGEL